MKLFAGVGLICKTVSLNVFATEELQQLHLSLF